METTRDELEEAKVKVEQHRVSYRGGGGCELPDGGYFTADGGGGRRARVCTSVLVRWSVLLYGGCCELLWPVILEVWILVRLV